MSLGSNKNPKVPFKDYILPAQELDLLQERVIIITGVARSGTTILGKIIGSMQPAFYLFEPAAMKYLPFLGYADPKQAKTYASLIRSLFIEDYFLPIAQGRNLNLNQTEDSYVGHYLSLDQVKKFWLTPSRRKRAVAQLRDEHRIWVIKTTGYQHLFGVTREIFPRVKFLHILRNGNDVVSSALKRGWYTDQYMERELVDWAQLPRQKGSSNLPWYLDEESKEYFGSWNQATRAASIWRCLTKAGMDEFGAHPEDCLQLTYEELIQQPQEWVKRFSRVYGLKPNKLTSQHSTSVLKHKLSVYPSVLKSIQHPEKDKFSELMLKLGYEVDA